MICLASNSTSKRYSIFSFDLFHYSILIIIFNIEFPSIKYTQAESYRTLSAFFTFRYLICKYTESYIIVYQIESDSFLHIPISYWTKWNLLQIQKITKFLRINQYNKQCLSSFKPLLIMCLHPQETGITVPCSLRVPRFSSYKISKQLVNLPC